MAKNKTKDDEGTELAPVNRVAEQLAVVPAGAGSGGRLSGVLGRISVIKDEVASAASMLNPSDVDIAPSMADVQQLLAELTCKLLLASLEAQRALQAVARHNHD